jgi:hypothetical protein
MNSGSDKNYHSYDKRVAADSSKADAIRAGIANDPTPGNDKPASAGGTNNNASPTIFGHDNPISSPVKTYLTESGVTVNVTQPGHPLFPGYVVRSVDTAGVVHNAGEGTGALQAPDSLAADRINGVWISQTKEIIDGIK